MRWRLSLFGALAAVAACTPAGNFECARDEECVSNNIAGMCQSNDYCSFPDPACDSGQRYAEHAPAGFAEQCVPPEVAGSTGSTSAGEGGGASSAGGASSDAGSGPGTTRGGPADDAEDSGEVEFDDSCVEVDLGSGLGIVDARDFSQEDDDLSPSCEVEDGRDVVYRFTAPVLGEYRFRAVGQFTSVVVSLWSSCSGSELACGENLFDPFRSTVNHPLEQGESVVVSVDMDDTDAGNFELEIILVPQ